MGAFRGRVARRARILARVLREVACERDFTDFG